MEEKTVSLGDAIGDHYRLTATHKKALERLGITTIRDVLFHFPARYDSIQDTKSVSSLKKGEAVVVYGKLSGLKTRRAYRRKTPMSEGYVSDASGKIKVIWFNQPYLAKMIQDGAHVQLSGTVTGKEGNLYLANPQIGDHADVSPNDSLFRGDDEGVMNPVYPETRGITSRWFYHVIDRIFKSGALDQIHDPIPEAILKKYHLPKLETALIWIHTPQKQKDAEAARKRFAFEEIFLIQLCLLYTSPSPRD